jgi:hypothetical protein
MRAIDVELCVLGIGEDVFPPDEVLPCRRGSWNREVPLHNFTLASRAQKTSKEETYACRPKSAPQRLQTIVVRLVNRVAKVDAFARCVPPSGGSYTSHLKPL